MRLLVVSSAPLISGENNWKAYSPYAKEMEIWAKHTDGILFCCPIWDTERGLLVSELAFVTKKPIVLIEFDLTSLLQLFYSLYAIPINMFRIYLAMKKADHIHLRCPGNIGLLGSIVQVFFPRKTKTAKYAGNWDDKSEQPISYKLQKWILSTTFLTRNMQVLVYGEWTEQTKNIKPFFTATYTEKDKKPITDRDLQPTIALLFVGTLSKGKRPLYTVELAKRLLEMGYDVQLKLYGEGAERKSIENYISSHNLKGIVTLMGNRSKEEIQHAYEQSHFLILPSQSEGWPKVVAEAMFWGCVPVSTKVSCVAHMLGNGTRGLFLDIDLETDITLLRKLIDSPLQYQEMQNQAVVWSRTYTLDYFEDEIEKLLRP